MAEDERFYPVMMLFLVLLAAMFALNPAARADYYKYTDSKGVICITNDPKAVPHKYTATMKVIHEDKAGRTNSGNRAQVQVQQAVSSATQGVAPASLVTPSPPPSAPGSRFGQISAQFPWITPLVAFGSVIVTFFVLIKLKTLISSPQTVKLTCLALLLGSFVITCKFYVDHLISGFFTAKTGIFHDPGKR